MNKPCKKNDISFNELDCIIEDRPIPITGVDTRAATAIAITVTRSLDGARRVTVAEVGD